MNNQKRSKGIVALFLTTSVLMLSSLAFFVSSPATSAETVTMQSDIVSSYINNSARRIASDVVGAENARLLPYDFSPAQGPDESKFSLVGERSYYKDSTIEVECWKQVCGDVTCWFADVKIKHASQFRRQWANGDYASKSYQYPSNMFKASNGVVGMSADFYKHRNYGIVVQYGTVFCNKPTSYQQLDVLTIDYDGNFKIWNENELCNEIKSHGADNIMLSFTFGPALVQNGKAVEPSHWAKQTLGELHQSVGRAAIGQKGELHYILCTAGNPGINCKSMAEIMEAQGCITAYNLDGGQSGTLLFNGKVYNRIAYMGVERAMSDIIYFGSAE